MSVQLFQLLGDERKDLGLRGHELLPRSVKQVVQLLIPALHFSPLRLKLLAHVMVSDELLILDLIRLVNLVDCRVRFNSALMDLLDPLFEHLAPHCPLLLHPAGPPSLDMKVEPRAE
jgi:hypothetical protein